MKEKIKNLFQGVWNVPNVLTMIRLVLIPVFATLLMTGRDMPALGVFCVASFTDALDGFIARKWKLITPFGQLMDPLADKLLVVTALICQAVLGHLPWLAIAIVVAKELYMVAGSFYMLKNDVVVYANYLGKVSTCCFLLALILSFFHDSMPVWGLPLDQILVWLAVVLSLAAMIKYTVSGKQKLNEQK